ncbi:MAG: conjugal transfer protein TraF [Zetaproteobacteria bacterium]|nr:MAG: conjugal transfer protein TraF [Zetaproteobacteria bacterium]
MRALALALLACCAQAAYASDPGSFLAHRPGGWFWYEQHDDRAHRFPPRSVKEARKELERLLEAALEDPTPERVAAYIRLQNWLNARAEAFAAAWRRALVLHPELDYSIEHPTDARGIVVKREQELRRKREVVRRLARRYGLFFVFRSTCPFCHEQAPMLKRFERRYGMAVLPISTDGGGLPEYPNPMPDWLSARVRVPVVPALFLVDPHARRIVPIAYGMVSERELVDRIVDAARALDGAER